MKTVELTYGGHEWEKKNIMTLGKKRMYDLYKCKHCGIEGKSYHLGTITVPEKYKNKLQKCKRKSNHTKVKIILCRAVGHEFSKLIPGSIHDIITPPKGYDNSKGEWVQGLTEPVLLLSGEFEYLED